MMRLHNSVREVIDLLPARQQSHRRKPNGIWWTDGPAWRDLVESGATAALERKMVGAFDHEVRLVDGFRLLTIATWADIVAFSDAYAQPMPHAAGGFFWQSGDRQKYDHRQDEKIARGIMRAFLINWPEVSRDFDGIEITMPVGEARADRPFVEWLDLDWDLPSGCAWNTDRIELDLVAHPESPSP